MVSRRTGPNKHNFYIANGLRQTTQTCGEKFVASCPTGIPPYWKTLGNLVLIVSYGAGSDGPVAYSGLTSKVSHERKKQTSYSDRLSLPDRTQLLAKIVSENVYCRCSVNQSYNLDRPLSKTQRDRQERQVTCRTQSWIARDKWELFCLHGHGLAFSASRNFIKVAPASYASNGVQIGSEPPASKKGTSSSFARSFARC